MQDLSGNTPLHLAAKDWPQRIVKSLLRFGADMSIKNEENKRPLKKISENVILDVLNSHFMQSTSNMVDVDDTNSNDEQDNEDANLYRELLEDYEPRHMTNIGNSPVKFDYELLAPTRYFITEKEDMNALSLNDTTSSGQPEMTVLAEISESTSHQKVIQHPLVKSFVWLKWLKCYRYYNRELRTDLLMTVFLTMYLLQQFGGEEWNNKCKNYGTVLSGRESSPKFDNTTWKDNQFCDYFNPPKSLNNNRHHHHYGELEGMSIIDRSRYYFQHFVGSVDGTDGWDIHCKYTRPHYLIYVLIAIALTYWMWRDVKLMLSSKNPFERIRRENRKRELQRENEDQNDSQFLTKVLPLGDYIKDFFLILLVLIFPDIMLWEAITILLISSVFAELLQLINGYQTYFLKVKNWADLLLIALVIVILYVPNDYIVDPLFFSLKDSINKICPLESYKQQVSNITIANHLGIKRGLAGFMIVFSWTRILFQIARHPGKRTETLNKYILMYRTVAKSFLKLLIIYSLFIISFALGFYLIFHNDIGESKLKLKDGESTVSPYRFFDTPMESLVKTFAMFIGEVDFNNIPIGISYERRHGNISASLAYFFFLCFIFMVVMVLMNLLNGLAVSDIAQIVADAEVQHQISMIHILKDLEDIAISNKKGIDRISRGCRCLKSILKIFDYSEALKLFPSKGPNTTNPNDIRLQGVTGDRNNPELQVSTTPEIRTRALSIEEDKTVSNGNTSIYGYQPQKEKMMIELPTDAQPIASYNQDAIMGDNRDPSTNPNDQTSIYGNRQKKIKKVGCEKILNEARRILLNNRKSIHQK